MAGKSTKAPVASNNESGGSDVNSLKTVLATLGDTTWRMFFPPALGALVGWWIDDQSNTKYAALIGTVAGAILAGLLVWQQYRSVTKETK